MEQMNSMWASIQQAMGGSVPQFLQALALFIVGWITAMIVRALARKGMHSLGVNQRFNSATGGKPMDIEGIVSTILFWLVLLLTLGVVLNALNLTVASSSVATLTTTVFAYIPRIAGAIGLALVAWLVASLVRALSLKVMARTTMDEKLSTHAQMAPMSDTLSQALFWLIILLFIPAILGVLELGGLLTPLRDMMTKALGYVPNIFGAGLIAFVGWIVATILRNVVSNLVAAAGVDEFGQKVGLSQTAVQHRAELGYNPISGAAHNAAEPATHTALAPLTQQDKGALASRFVPSKTLGLLVYLVIMVFSLIAALDALKLEAISRPATDMLRMLVTAVPHIIAAGLILFITWLVASFAAQLLSSFLASIGFNRLPERIGMQRLFGQAQPAHVAGHVVMFFAMLFAVVEAANQLGFDQVKQVVTTFIHFGGQVLLGCAILLVGFWLANVVYRAMDQGTEGSVVAKIVRFAILGLVLAMGLRAMGIADDIVNLAFGLTLGAVAVAFALAFGLGGREAAGKLAEHWIAKIKK